MVTCVYESWLKAQQSENEDHGIWSHHFMGNRWGNIGNSVRLYFWAPKSLQMVTATMTLKDAYSLAGSYDQPRQHIKKERHYFVNKGPDAIKGPVKAVVFPVVMYGCKSWIIKKAEH